MSAAAAVRQRTAERLLLVLVTDRPALVDAARIALRDLTDGSSRVVRTDVTGLVPPSPDEPGYRLAVDRARRYLDQVLPAAELRLCVLDSVADLAMLRAGGTGRSLLALLVIDHAEHRRPAISGDDLDRRLRSAAAGLDAVEFRPSPGTVHRYVEADDQVAFAAGLCTIRWPPTRPWVVAADLVCSFTDALQLDGFSRFHGTPPTGFLAEALAGFLTRQAGAGWGLHSYTGSVVSPVIDTLERYAARHGNPVVSGPSEHSLACSALARWQLDGHPFLIVVTSGMSDEFRGTLANLRAARARGFILCAESRAAQWHPFQGTVHTTEDTRAVFRARGLQVAYLDDPATVEAAVDRAVAAYERDEGPVVLLATREVLETPGTATARPTSVARPAPAVVAGDIDELVRVVNQGPVRVLCQAGPLSPTGRELLLTLAHRAGLALADSLTHPGTVSRYVDGVPVPQYLGTLSLYGHSAQVYDFLHSDGRLRPPSEQALIFLNTRIAEIDTPYSPLLLRRSRPIQVYERAEDRAPFIAAGLHGKAEEVLRIVLDRLDVPDDLLARRRAAIDAGRVHAADVIGAIPVRPMSPNYFFRQLGGVLEHLIDDLGYRYTGVFDVGRAGLSAVCNLPRTGPGFSGWFGRALMGDALQALPGVLCHRPDNVLAVVGDGAAALVPDIVPTLVRQVVVDGHALRGNVSIFRCVNGAHSVIRTYREGLQPAVVSGQTGVLSLLDGDWVRQIGGQTVRHRVVLDVAEVALADRLTTPGVIDLYSVLLGHNNEGDGLSRLAALSWQRPTLAGTRPAGRSTKDSG
ncbi:hypothetical protein ABZU25_17995 [Micromonospora sp. NPDC005215]|uniref:hypothetical protein n=1 Tax=Micromonospora sp. NPDC005215 TaxID=3157024 RepID=UPI00339F5AFF